MQKNKSSFCITHPKCMRTHYDSRATAQRQSRCECLGVRFENLNMDTFDFDVFTHKMNYTAVSLEYYTTDDRILHDVCRND